MIIKGLNEMSTKEEIFTKGVTEAIEKYFTTKTIPKGNTATSIGILNKKQDALEWKISYL